MSLKRGNLMQLGREGGNFVGSGASDEVVEAPKRATAAQLAGRKIKTPRSRLGGGATGSTGGSAGFGGASSGFGNSVSQQPATQPFQTFPNGGGSLFQRESSPGGFNFSATPASAPEVQFGASAPNGQQANTASGGYSGSMFSIPSAQNNVSMGGAFNETRAEPLNTASPQNNQSLFNVPSSFNFSSSNNNPFAANSQAQSNQDISNSTTSNLFAASASGSTPAASKTPLFGGISSGQSQGLFSTSDTSATNTFGKQQTPASQGLNLFASQPATTQPQNLFSAPTSSSQVPNLFAKGSNNTSSTPSPNLFSSTTQAGQGQGLFSNPSTKDTSNSFGFVEQQSQSKNLFQIDKEDSSKTDSASSGSKTQAATSGFNLFGTPSTNTVALPATNGPSESAAPVAQEKPNIFGFNNESPTPTSLFASVASGGAPTLSKPSSAVPFGNPSQNKNIDLFGAARPGVPSIEVAEKSTSQQNDSIPTENATSSLFGGKPAPLSSNQAKEAFSSNQDPSKATFANSLPNQQDKETPSVPGDNFSNFFQKSGKQQTMSSLTNAPTLFSGGDAFKSANPSMSTLNSSLAPKQASQIIKSIGDAVPPPAPSHLSQAQKAQWPEVWRLKLLSERVKQHLLASSDGGAPGTEEVVSFLLREANGIKERLKRKSTDKAGEEPSPKRLNTGTAPLQLFGTTSGSSSAALKPATQLFGSTNSTANLFGNAASGASSSQGGAASATSNFSPNQTSNAGSSSSIFALSGAKGGSEKAQTGEVAYPSLSGFSGSSQKHDAANASSSQPKFEVPKFGSATGGATNFLAQFGARAKKDDAEEAEKRKDQEYDSEEEDLDTWKKRDEEKRKAKQAEYDAISKNASLGFKFKPTSAASSSPSNPFAAKSDSSAEDKHKPAASTSLFGSNAGKTGAKAESSQAGASLFGQAAATNTSTGTPPASLFPTSGSSSSVLPAANPLPSKFSFGSPMSAAPAAATSSIFGTSAPSTDSSNEKKAGNLFATSTTAKFSESTGSLFDRIQKDKDGNPVRETSDNTFKGDSNTPIKFSKSLGPTLAPPSIASDTSRATTPATGDENESNAAADDEGSRDEQLDLSQAAVGEEDEDVLVEIRAKGTELVKNKEGKAEWVVRGVGQLKLLRHKETKKTRVLLRSSPAAKIVLNTHLIPGSKYVTTGSKNNSIRMPVVTGDGKIQQFLVMMKDPKDATDLANKMEENKAN